MTSPPVTKPHDQAPGGTGKQPVAADSCSDAGTLRRLELLSRKFGDTPQDVALRAAITAYRKDSRP